MHQKPPSPAYHLPLRLSCSFCLVRLDRHRPKWQWLDMGGRGGGEGELVGLSLIACLRFRHIQPLVLQASCEANSLVGQEIHSGYTTDSRKGDRKAARLPQSHQHSEDLGNSQQGREEKRGGEVGWSVCGGVD